jgi:hypothetical protein
MTAKIDRAEPAWVLDVAEDAVRRMRDALSDAMMLHGEDPTDTTLWRHRRSQLESLLASGKVLAVNHGASPEQSAARFADFYSVRYGDVGSTARALIVETDEPMEIRPVGDRKIIVKRA